ncbi:MAG: polyphenol oxidase family protein [Ancrocorticia sp.]
MELIDWTIQRRVPGGVIRGGFTTVAGGISQSGWAGLNLGTHVGDDEFAVVENRRRLATYLGCEPAWMDQVHSDTVAVAVGGETAPATDALVIDLSGAESVAGAAVLPQAACVMVADCVPLLLLSSRTLRAAAVHVGRAGFMKNIAAATIAAFDEDAGALTAIVGPSICGRCYEVPEAMREEARAVASSSVSQTRWGTPAIDIPAGLTEQLRSCGVSDVVLDGRCTYENESLYSHRRSTQAGLSAGRFVGVVQLLSDTPA